MTIHLNVIHEVEGENPSSAARLFDCGRYDFRWNDDYTAFEPLKLRWWDDASYAAYQSDEGES